MTTPAADEQEVRKRKDSVELCGKNRGPHDYIPVVWDGNDVKTLICRVCFCHIDVQMLLDNNPKLRY